MTKCDHTYENGSTLSALSYSARQTVDDIGIARTVFLLFLSIIIKTSAFYESTRIRQISVSLEA